MPGMPISLSPNMMPTSVSHIGLLMRSPMILLLRKYQFVDHDEVDQRNTWFCSLYLVQFVLLVYLVLIHKLEYFLNSKIIGERIKSPMWLTLVGIILGERLMGIPGMILAPVVLHYVKVEALRNKLREDQTDSPASPAATGTVNPPTP